jgi:hypothetical protein
VGSRSFQSRASARADALNAGRYDLLVEDYAFPLTIYVMGVPTVLRDRTEAWAFYQSFHSTLLACGIARLTARVVAEDLPRGGRCRFWTDWMGEGPNLALRRVASTICYARLGKSDMLTEMLEFTRLDLPLQVAA